MRRHSRKGRPCPPCGRQEPTGNDPELPERTSVILKHSDGGAIIFRNAAVAIAYLRQHGYYDEALI